MPDHKKHTSDKDAKDTKKNTAEAPKNPQDSQQLPLLQVNAQYVKDLSFESPNAPMSLGAPKTKPRIDVAIDIQAKGLQENVYEVALNFTVKALADEKAVIFLVELSYAGVFTLNNIPLQEREPLLMIYCPNMLFPFARRVIGDVSRDGGFLPLMLEPIDFAALYQRRKAAVAAQNSDDDKAN
ncbi:MAG: protein translocase subunit secB [Rickettsiales bacterium]|jgi:preprotein translocase subunit SecB|nr:protein translocase subunit secB [Rickettsiales bacterium]